MCSTLILSWKPQVLHDLHESVPYLYDNTIGDGPYNAWVDPILTDEWQMIGWKNVSEMTKFGMPGVFAHGNFRHVVAGLSDVHRGDAQRHQPPLRNVRQCGRRHFDAHAFTGDYRTHLVQAKPASAQSANGRSATTTTISRRRLLISLDYFNNNSKLFLKNFYLKIKRSIEKPKNEGPAAYVFPGDDPRPGNQANYPADSAGTGLRDSSRDRAVHGDNKERRRGPRQPRRHGRQPLRRHPRRHGA